MSKARDIANILSASTAIATDAELTSLYPPMQLQLMDMLGGEQQQIDQYHQH